MKDKHRIIFNALATYGRTMFSMLTGLFSVRWVLAALGQTDYGLYGVVGTLVFVIIFINGVLGSSIARFYAYAIGKQQNAFDDVHNSLNGWFNSALLIHTSIPLALLAIGYPIGIWVIEHKLVIPTDRLDACVWVFRIALVTAFFNMVSIPYVSMFLAYQNIVELSFFGVAASFCTFIGAFFLRYCTTDKLVVYALIMMMINAGIPALQMWRAKYKYPVCRIDLSKLWDTYRLKQLMTYAGWKIWGSICFVTRMQGSVFLVNFYFGAKVNSSYAIAQQVLAYASSLSIALVGAIQPAITSIEGSGNRREVERIALQASKFSSYLTLFFCLPLIFEINTVLLLWLQNPPLYTGGFCVFMLGSLWLDQLSTGYLLAINAHGKVAAYEIVLGAILLLTLPLVWLCFQLGYGPLSLGAVFLFTMIFWTLGRVIMAKFLLKIPIIAWVKQVVLPILLLTGAVCLINYTITCLLSATLVRLLIIGASTTAILSISGWYCILEPSEKNSLLHLFTRMIDQFRILKTKIIRS